jgi:hypothetical protein
MSTPSGEGDRPPLRIGTKERESAYAALNAHLDAGRLDVDEYGERYAKANLARTRAELDELFTDLPVPHPVFEPDPASVPSVPSWVTNAQPRRRPAFRLLPAAFAIVPLVAIVLAISTGFWFFFFLIPMAASFIARGFGHRGFGHRGYGRRGYGAYR